MAGVSGSRCGVMMADKSRFFSPSDAVCGKRAKGKLRDGTPACGIHLRSEHALAEKESSEMAENMQRLAFAHELSSFNAKHGMDVLVHDGSKRQVIVPFDLLSDLVSRGMSEPKK